MSTDSISQPDETTASEVAASVRASLEHVRAPAESVSRLIDGFNQVIKTGCSKAEYAQIRRMAKETTGLNYSELGLHPWVDREKLERVKRRRQALKNGDTSVLDPEDFVGISEAFLRCGADHEGMPALVRWQESWWQATSASTSYVQRTPEAVTADIYAFTDGKQSVSDDSKIKASRSFIENATHALRAVAHHDVSAPPAWIEAADDLPAASEMIALQNGLLHYPTRALYRPTRKFFNLNAVAFAYQANPPSPLAWLTFLDQLWPGDAESIETLQELFGLALTGDTSHHKIFMIVGKPRSGKGTIARVLTELVGLENTSSPTLNGLGQHFGLESLIGKRLAIVSDARIGGKADLGAITENLLRISGEDAISVPRKHRPDWTAKLAVRFLVLTNEVPALLDQSGALASRFVLLRLTRSFLGQEDRGLTAKLLGELPSIFVWALQGLDRLQARGFFRQPQSAMGLVRQLETLASPIRSFVEERCELSPGAASSVQSLYNAWREWEAEQGRTPSSVAMFGKHLSAAFPELRLTQPRIGGARVRVYEGVRLARAGTRETPLQGNFENHEEGER